MKLKRNVKIKKITKRMKVKKTLASSAAALVISGSLLPVGNVFAENQSTQENSISAAESKAKLENELSIPSLQNDEKKTQETQSSEIIDKNEKINIPEAAQEKSNNNENTELDSLNNNPILSNSVKTRLSDGRVSLDVSTIDQIQEAFNNSLIGQINFTKDFTLDRNIQMDSTKNANLVINGNGHTLDFTDKRFAASDSDKGLNLKIKDLNTKNSKSGTLRACFYAPFATVELENIDHEGTDLLAANKIRLSGKINCYANKETIDGCNTALTTWWGKWDPNCYVVVSSGADVTFEQHIENSTNPYGNGTVLHTSNLILEDNSKCTVKTSDSNFQWGALCVAAPACTENILNIGNNAQLNVEYNAADGVGYGIDFWENPASLKISKTGELNVVSAGAGAILTRVANSVLDLSEGKFDIQATNGGLVNMMAGGRISFDTKNVYGWFKSFTTLPKPSISWENVDGDAQLSGWNTQKVSTTNEKFNNEFKTQNLGRISSEGSLIQELTKTTINEVKDTDTIVSGKGEPNASIIIKVGDQPIGNGTVDSEGNYSVPIQKQSAGTIIKAVVTKDGLSSEASTVVKNTANATITKIDSYEEGKSNYVTGTYAGTGVAYIRVFVNGEKKALIPMTNQEAGTFKYYISGLKATDRVEVALYDGGYKELARKNVTVTAPVVLAPTTISNMDTQTTTVTGTGEPNATIQLKAGNKVIAEGTVGSDGKYSFTIEKQAEGTLVKAIVTKAGLTSEASTTVIKGSLDQTTISAITTETTTVTGTGEPNATIQLKVGDKVIAEGKVGSDGKYSFTIEKQPGGSVVVAVVTKDNKTSEASTVVKNTANATITKVDPYEEGKSNYVTGTYTGTGVSYIRVFVNGTKKTLIPMTGQEAGKFKYYINGLKATDKVEVSLYDSSYKELARKNVTVVAPSAVSITQVAPYKEGISQYVEGTYSGEGIAYIRVVVNGKNQALVPMTGQSQGAFKYYISNLKVTDDVKVQLYNRDYTLLAQKQVPIESTANVKITGVEKYIEGKSDYVRGTYDGEGAAYIRLVVNGVNKAMVPMVGQAQGTFSYYVQGLKTTDNVKVVLFDAQYRVLGEEKVIVEAPTVSNVTITSVGEYAEGKSEWITGSYEGDNVSYVGLIVNEKAEMRVPISDPVAKTFKYYKSGLKATDNVQVVLYNKKAEEVARKQLVITEPAVSNIKITSLSDYKVGKTEWITGSYEGEGASLVGLIIDGNEKDTVKVAISDPAAKTFRYYKRDLKPGQNVQVVLYGKDGKEVARKQLVIAS